MSALDHLLANLRIEGSVYFCDALKPPWEMQYTNETRAMFHRVRRGGCTFEIRGEIYDLGPGDLIFIAPMIDHSIRANAGKASDTLLLCGYGEFNSSGNNLLLGSIPEYVVIRSEVLHDLPWLERTLEHLSAEYMSGEPGSQITVNKLTEILLLQLIRAEFGAQKETGIIAAFRDKRLSVSLDRIHEDLSYPWTLEKSAELANMSRSGFARLFSNALGVGFLPYLTLARIQQAKHLLATTRLSVESICQKVGYQSEPAFIKVFKRIEGQTPRAYRIKHTRVGDK